MAIYYVDYEGGNDSNNGTTFALRKKTINGATNVATGGDEVRVMGTPVVNTGKVADWTSGPAHNLNIGSPSSVTLGNPTIVNFSSNHGLVTGDLVRISNANLGVLNGYWEVTYVSNTSFSITINTTGYGAYSNNGSGRVYKANQLRVTIDSPMTEDICLNGQFGLPNKDAASGQSWTASTNVAVSNTFYGTTNVNIPHTSMFYVSIAPNATFTTGKAAYATLPAAKDLSGYKQISFWFRQTGGSGTQQSGISIRLCSDTLGDTTVNTFSVPGSGAVNVWQPVTLNFGSALGSSIQSIAMYVDTDLGAITWEFQGFIAVKGVDDPNGFLSYTSLITSGRTGDIYYPVRMIQKNNIIIDDSKANTDITSTPSSWRGYNYLDASNHTTTKTYTKETGLSFFVVNPIDISRTYINYVYRASSDTTTLDQIGSGNGTLTPTSDNPLTISGGWNRTDMSTQDANTYTFLQSNGKGRFYINTKTNVTIKNLIMTRCHSGFYVYYGNHITLENCGGGITNNYPFYGDYTRGWQTKDCFAFYNGYGQGYFTYAVLGYEMIGCKTINCVGNIYYLLSTELTCNNNISKNLDNGDLFQEVSNIKLNNCSYINMNNRVHWLSQPVYSFESNKQTVNGATRVLEITQTGFPVNNISFTDLNQINVTNLIQNESSTYIPRLDDLNPVRISLSDGQHFSFGRNYRIEQSLTDFRTSSPSLKLILTQAAYTSEITGNAGAPILIPFAKVAVKNTGTVTFKAWIKSAFSTGLFNLGLVTWLPELGVPDPVRSNLIVASTINPQYKEAILEFTPTRAGVVEIYIECFNISFTTNGIYIDDISVTQV